jgi:hypothetical protein
VNASGPRRIGPIGTTVRVVLGLALLVFALIRGVEPYEPALGLVVFPGIMVGIGLIGQRVLGHPLRFTGPGGIAVNCAAIVVLFVIPYTTGAAALFYGISLVVAAARGAPHCEATILSNLILRRDDQIGCPTMTPIDALEARYAAEQ